MNGMMLHCGAQHLTRDELAVLPVPQPMGPQHVVRPFIDDVELTALAMAENGLVIKEEGYGVTRNADGIPQRFFGLMELSNAADDFGLMVGLRGSYDQRLARGMVVGSNVFVSDNLCFSGEIEMRTKQTTNVADRIPQLIRDAVARIPGMAASQEAKFDVYREHKVARRVGDAMLIEMVRRGILVPSQLGRALAEWDKSIHEEHEQFGDSLWKLHNAVTEAIKPANPERAAVPAIWERTVKMTQLLDDVTVNGFRVYH